MKEKDINERMSSVEYFPLGCVVSCQTADGANYSGEVIAFDERLKIVVLKHEAISGKSDVNDLFFINTTMLKSASLITEPPPQDSFPPLEEIDHNKVRTRIKNSVDARQGQAHYRGINVTPQAQQLFYDLAKTTFCKSEDIVWDNQNIVLFGNVKVQPPYNAENVVSLKGDARNASVDLVRKLVEKFYIAQQDESSAVASK